MGILETNAMVVWYAVMGYADRDKTVQNGQVEERVSTMRDGQVCV
jgi:hypothetical protein